MICNVFFSSPRTESKKRILSSIVLNSLFQAHTAQNTELFCKLHLKHNNFSVDLKEAWLHCWIFTLLFFFFRAHNNYLILLPILSLLVFTFIQSTKQPQHFISQQLPEITHNLNIALIQDLWICRSVCFCGFLSPFCFVKQFLEEH